MLRTALLLLCPLLSAPYADWQSDHIFFNELAGRRVEVPVSHLAPHGYASVEREGGTNDSGILVCRAGVGQLATDWMGPVVNRRHGRTDLGLIVTARQGHGWQEIIVASGPDDLGEAYFFLPNIDLSKPYQLEVEAFDRDIYRHDKLENFSYQAPAGNKWHYQGKFTTLDCQAMSSWLFGDFINQEKKQFALNIKDLQVITKYSIDELTIQSLDYLATPARDNVRELAGLLGWKNQEVEKLLQQLLDEEKRLQPLIQNAIDEKLLQAKTKLALPNMTLTYEGSFTAKNSPRDIQQSLPFFNYLTPEDLFFKIKVENTGTEPLEITTTNIGQNMQSQLIGPLGHNNMPRINYYWQKGHWLPLDYMQILQPRENITLLLVPASNEELLTAKALPLLLRQMNMDTYKNSYLLLK